MEVIVVADGPDPRIAPVIAELGTWPGSDVRLLEQVAAGPAAARNRGATSARGEFIAFTDDDCLPAPDWAVLLIAALEPQADAIVGGRVVNGVTGLPCARAAQLVVDVVQDHYGRGTRRGAFLTSNNLALSRDAFAALGGFDEAFTGAAAEDRDLCERATEAGYRIAYSAAVVEHKHALTAPTLLRQQYRYGRGARTLARRRAARSAPPLLPEAKLYRELVAAAWREGGTGLNAASVRMVALVALTQMAYACGMLVGDRRPWSTAS
jgi:GT2 family glycosyltransferase